MAAREWLKDARIDGDELILREDFEQLFTSISIEVSRVGKIAEARPDEEATAILEGFHLGMDDDSPGEPVLVTMKHVAVPGTKFAVGEHDMLLQPWDGAEADLAQMSPTNLTTKADMEDLLAGLRSL